jgi:hypothetical protein
MRLKELMLSTASELEDFAFAISCNQAGQGWNKQKHLWTDGRVTCSFRLATAT